MNALALTDHGNLYGALDFYQKARAGGINPIIGYEAYIAPGSRFSRDAVGHEGSQLPPDAVGAEPHRLQKPDQAGQQGLSRGLLLQAAHRQGAARSPQRRHHLLERLRLGRVQPRDPAKARRPARPGAGHEDRGLVRQSVRRPLLHRDPEQRARNPAARHAGRRRSRPADGHSAGGHQRRALREPRRCRSAGRAAVHQHGQVSHRPRPHAHGGRPVLPAQRRGNAGRHAPARRGPGPEPADRRLGRHSIGSRPATLSHLRTAAGEVGAGLPARAVHPGSVRALRRRRRALHRGRVGAGRAGAAGLRAVGHRQAGLPQLLPDRVGLRALRARARHSGHGPRQRRGLAGGLRAVSEPRLPVASTTCCSSAFWTRAARKRPISTSIFARTAAAK